MTISRPHPNSARMAVSTLAAAAWLVTLIASALPDTLYAQFYGSAPAWLFPAKILVIAAAFLGTWVWRDLALLRNYLILLLITRVGWDALLTVRSLSTWSAWESSLSWSAGMLVIQAMKFGIALLALAALWVIYRRRSAFYLVKGKLDAAAEPVRWLGIGRDTSWKTLAPVFAAIAAAVMLVVLSITSLPIAGIEKALPLLPVALLLSATNAISEEISYRSALLAPLAPAIGKNQALWITAVFFGLAHAAGGVPLETLPSVLMTGFLGWVMGKSMLETRGFTWPWFIHFLNDLPVFVFLALGST